tara:strand:- start:2548 stop:3444 length:897 start_codon:yes stop_codon:yes gene_type:complete
MRNTFIKDLISHARSNEKIALVVGDLGYSVIEPFAEEFPDRFINAGVAEQNMAGMAAGMASEGYHVFAYSIANFPLYRCAEQIRNDIDYHNLPVTIVSVGGGLAYGNLGYSHHGVQDFALVRTMPNMLLAAPGDPYETSSCIDFLVNNPQPSYLRINKSGEPNINISKIDLLPGFINMIDNQNSENLVLTSGSILNHVFKIYSSSKETQKNWSIGTLPLWGEATRKKVYEELAGFKNIVVIEEHLQSGGLSSYLLELGLSIKALYLDSKVCGEVGDQDFLISKFGLSKEKIISTLMAL